MNSLPGAYRWLLLLSLALNLGLGAAVAVQHWHHHHPGEHMSGERRWARVPDPRHLARLLGEADRAILREVFDKHREALRGRYQPLGAARRQLAEALRSEPFDPAAMQRAFDSIRGAEGDTANALHTFMLELATRVSADGRRRIAEQLERRGHDHSHRKRGEGEPPAKPTPEQPSGA